MTRGEVTMNKVHYQGADEDYIVFVDDVAEFNKWKSDKSIALAHFMANFKVYITHKQGAEGNYDSASKSTLENEFNTSDVDEAIKIILEKGTLQASKESARQGDRNINSGPRINH